MEEKYEKPMAEVISLPETLTFEQI